MSRGAAGWLAVALATAACGGVAGGDDVGDDVAPDADVTAPDGGAGPDAAGCATLEAAPAWLDAELRDTVARLSGAADLTAGVRLVDRSAPARRAAVRDWLEAELDGLGLDAQQLAYGTGSNVVARLPGTEPAAGWIVVGAHLDTVQGSPGANDDGSGVAAVLATARLLRDTCRRTGVIVAFFDQEEIGIVGSTALAGALFQAGEHVVAVHTVDQVGWDSDGDRVFEIELPTDALYAAYQAAAAALGVGVRRTQTGGTDHVAFRERGYAAAGVTEEFVGGDTTPYYHMPGDTYDTVDFAYAAAAVRLVSRVVDDAAR
ncbi:MAG: M20/M25/M40 family metallo-hydrolase [Kofleriaceae bacterium]|nr:M20/M25/M40 family metallo-hydrolase [Kofleriaceae bacterium]MCB9575345.1 M20/M25/M40 family metallo-hydrolase [Kofleriaceae bacterium]